ncbi:MAG: hypothetical protein AAB490_02780 [Patescibacteria group bacterium]
MSWLQIVLIAYFILSITNLVDKIFLSTIVAKSVVYMLWVNVLSVVVVLGFVLVAILYQASGGEIGSLGALTWMTPWFIGVAVLAGIFFTLAIYFLYSGLQSGEASRVVPLIGGSIPVFTYCMTFWYAPLDGRTLLAFVILISGTVLISLMPSATGIARARRDAKPVFYALGSSLSFAALFVVTQYIFYAHGFINGVVWPRLGAAIAIAVVLAKPEVQRALRESFSGISGKQRAVWFTNQGFNAVGFLGQLYAISLPGVSVALVTALLGVQYSFVLIFATLLSLRMPTLLHEKVSSRTIIQKICAIILIAFGLYLVS